MSKKEKKFYVIWEGHKKGIFNSWAECKRQTQNYKGAKYKSFESKALAKEAYKGTYSDHVSSNQKKPPKLSRLELEYIGQPDYHSIAVDAASSGNPGVMEYRGVDTKTKAMLFYNGPFEKGTNNVGEFLALVHGLAYLKDQNSDRSIYTDSRTAISWVTKKRCNTKLAIIKENRELFKLIDRAVLWLKENSFNTKIIKWETKAWGEIPADFGRK